MISKILRTTMSSGGYAIQRLTKYRYDSELEWKIKKCAGQYLSGDIESDNMARPNQVHLDSLNFSDTKRFHLVRDDIYSRFVVSDNGMQKDSFGRMGVWIPRGCKLYLDNEKNEFIKIFDEHFCQKGEGAFLVQAIELGLYRFLCPGLKYLLIDDNGNIRGYSISAGRELTHYEFERYVQIGLRDVIEAETKRTQLYFYDLTPHNVIIKDRQISLIDLESVLPLGWYGQGKEFARQHLDQVDLGWAVQNKWHSPGWYKKYIKKLDKS